MFYTIYKITNKINNKFYIGMHKTNDLNDGYMGSGKMIRRAISKYGIDNFVKEILHIFDNEQDMKNKEKELVILSEMSYNLCEGGKGGFSYINVTMKNKMTELKSHIQKNKPKNYYSDLGYKSAKVTSHRMKKMHREGLLSAPNWTGKKHSEETKQKMRKSKNVGINNPNYGTMWITDGKENKRIKKEELLSWIEKGYYRGRIS